MAFSKLFPLMVARIAALSILLFVMAIPQARAHEIDPGIADVLVTQERIAVDIQMSLESILSEMDLASITDTTQAPEEEVYNGYRSMGPDALRAAVEDFWPRMAPRLVIEVDGERIVPELVGLSIPDVGDIGNARTSTISIAAAKPTRTSPNYTIPKPAATV